jgi:predicted DNA-binding WGR domain protein
MLKLYKRVEGELHYWETWNRDKKTALVHWGKVGEEGKTEAIRSTVFTSYKKKVQSLVNKKSNEGYQEIEDIYILLIEYGINWNDAAEDMDKRNRLEGLLNETLGWTGLGHCNGGNINDGAFDICCYVVDFDLAKKVIEKVLHNTEFSNYKRIYDEDLEYSRSAMRVN